MPVSVIFEDRASCTLSLSSSGWQSSRTAPFAESKTMCVSLFGCSCMGFPSRTQTSLHDVDFPWRIHASLRTYVLYQSGFLFLKMFFVRVWLYRSWSALGALVTANALTLLVCLFVCFRLFLSVSVARDVRCGGGRRLSTASPQGIPP